MLPFVFHCIELTNGLVYFQMVGGKSFSNLPWTIDHATGRTDHPLFRASVPFTAEQQALVRPYISIKLRFDLMGVATSGVNVSVVLEYVEPARSTQGDVSDDEEFMAAFYDRILQPVVESSNGEGSPPEHGSRRSYYAGERQKLMESLATRNKNANGRSVNGVSLGDNVKRGVTIETAFTVVKVVGSVMMFSLVSAAVCLAVKQKLRQSSAPLPTTITIADTKARATPASSPCASPGVALTADFHVSSPFERPRASPEDINREAQQSQSPFSAPRHHKAGAMLAHRRLKVDQATEADIGKPHIVTPPSECSDYRAWSCSTASLMSPESTAQTPAPL